MIKFSEFYGPERQRELLPEAKNRRFSQGYLADQHNHTSKEENKMYSRISIAFIVVGLFVAGFGMFNSSVTRAASHCVGYSSATLAANPELLKINCSEVTAEAETNVQRAFEASAARYRAMAEYYAGTEATNLQRANEAYSARYSGLAEFYTAGDVTTDSSYLASNPELNAVRGYTGAIENEGSQPVTFDLEALREFFAHEWTIEADTIDPSPLMQPVSNGIEMTEADFLAANPELKIVRRYTGAIENKGSQPVTFDLEALREFYSQEWTVEADTIDPSPLMQTAQAK